MNKELFVKAGQACFGDSWQAQTQRRLGVKNRGTLTKWINGTNRIPENVHNEMLAIAKSRQIEIDEMVKELEKSKTDTM